MLIKTGGIYFELRDTQKLTILSSTTATPLPTSYISLKVGRTNLHC